MSRYNRSLPKKRALLIIIALLLFLSGCGKWVSDFDEAWESEDALKRFITTTITHA